MSPAECVSHAFTFGCICLSVPTRNLGYSINMKAASSQTLFPPGAVSNIAPWQECSEKAQERNKRGKAPGGLLIHRQTWGRWRQWKRKNGKYMSPARGMIGGGGEGGFGGPSICSSLRWGLGMGRVWWIRGELCKGDPAVTGEHLR